VIRVNKSSSLLLLIRRLVVRVQTRQGPAKVWPIRRRRMIRTQDFARTFGNSVRKLLRCLKLVLMF
jgi:hypothetical protein